MISLTTAQLNVWIAAFFFPLARILALLAAAPPFSNPGLTTRVRLILGLAIAVAVTPALPTMPGVEPASGIGLLIFAQQLLIGFAIGFTLRLVFNAVDLAGTMIGYQMGLGFATSYDPQNASQSPVVSEFVGVLALLTFLSMNGHLMVLATLVQSFTVIPVGVGKLAAATWLNIANAGGVIFVSGVFLALPVVVALLITNTALGILGRVAPQLNIIAVGFPVTLILGFIALQICLNYLAAPLQQLFEYGLDSMIRFFVLA